MGRGADANGLNNRGDDNAYALDYLLSQPCRKAEKQKQKLITATGETASLSDAGSDAAGEDIEMSDEWHGISDSD